MAQQIPGSKNWEVWRQEFQKCMDVPRQFDLHKMNNG